MDRLPAYVYIDVRGQRDEVELTSSLCCDCMDAMRIKESISYGNERCDKRMEVR